MSESVDRAPFAVTVDGKILANLVSPGGEVDVNTVARRAVENGDVVFVGVVLRPPERESVFRRFENAAAEALSWVMGARSKRQTGATDEPSGPAPTPDGGLE